MTVRAGFTFSIPIFPDLTKRDFYRILSILTVPPRPSSTNNCLINGNQPNFIAEEMFEMEEIKKLIEWSATGFELVTVVTLVAGSLFGLIRFVAHIKVKRDDAYHQFKKNLGKMLILSLEFLVAADIIKTVALAQTIDNILVLGLLVIIRTFLSWSTTVEIEGRWPWTIGKAEAEVAE